MRRFTWGLRVGWRDPASGYPVIGRLAENPMPGATAVSVTAEPDGELVLVPLSALYEVPEEPRGAALLARGTIQAAIRAKAIQDVCEWLRSTREWGRPDERALLDEVADRIEQDYAEGSL